MLYSKLVLFAVFFLELLDSHFLIGNCFFNGSFDEISQFLDQSLSDDVFGGKKMILISFRLSRSVVFYYIS